MENKKTQLRKVVLALRNLINSEILEINSQTIMKKIEALPEFQSSAFVMCYVDFRNEVKTKDFIKFCFASGKRVAVPLIIKNEQGIRVMKASEIINFEEDLEIGNFGILEPKKEALRIINAKEVDLVIVPGAVFDILKNRIGYGGGFYDRFMMELRPECLKIGVAFELQLLKEIPFEDHDLKVDLLVTEIQII